MAEAMTQQSKRISQDNPSGWKNPWMLGLLGLISVVLLVNIGFITLAFVTNPGLVTEDYYEKGKYYEENVQKKLEARNQLGWTFNYDFPQNPVVGRNELYRVNGVDKAGLPLNDAVLTLKAYRPSDADADFDIKMNETIPGVYEASVNFPLKGLWEITVDIKRGENFYDFTRRASVVTQ